VKVLQVVQQPQRRGAEVFAADLSRALRTAGHEVSTAYLYPHHGEAALPLGPDDVVLGDRPDHPAERLLGAQPALRRALRARIATVAPEVVQTNGARSLKYAALAKGRQASWALVYRNIGEPGAWLRGWRQRLFYGRLMTRVDGAVAVSEATFAGLQQVHRLDVPVVRIPRSVDVEALTPATGREEVRRRLGTPEDAPVLVAVGSLTTEKRPDRLVRVFDAVRRDHPGAELWVLGSGPAAGPLEARATPGGPIRLLGVRDDVSDHLHAADLLLLTSDTEGVPGVVLEAGAVGRPAVATRVGGVTECVVDGETGLLADPEDETALARATSDLLADPARRQALGDAARRLVAERYSLAAAAERYVELYRRLVGP
jgi:glycosyltransferase involved in cell wall biosynthesis